MSHSVFHRFLHKVEALPAGVKLMLVRTFEVQEVADNLRSIRVAVNECSAMRSLTVVNVGNTSS